MIIDSHCHLDFPQFAEDLAGVLDRAEAAGVGRMVTISTRVKNYDTYRALAESDPRIFFTVGTHPHNAGEEPDVPAADLVARAQHPRCVAIGEAGLDYHYDKSPRDVQRKVFRTHIAAARETGLPLIIHAREADEEMIDILTDEFSKGPYKAVLHCFSSAEKLAMTGVELGFAISFSGIVTFKRSEELRDIARKIPRERLLVETDAPYLAPQPVRGQTNEPAYTAHTLRILAEALDIPAAELEKVTTENFYTLFAKAAVADGRTGG
ncbi:MAG: TatD family hydrolase [Salinarimonas sp.]